MLDLLFMGAAGLFMIGTLVIAHEAGHFVVARLFGVGTPVFSVGMGHRLFGFRWWDTDFRISMFPIGGYVRMAGADPFGEQSEDEQVPPEQDFMLRPVWQRFLIMGAGPAVNLALPLFVFTGLLMLGRPEVGPEVGRVFSGTAADRAGLRAGDVIRSVNGEPVEVWHDVVEALREHVGRALGGARRWGGARRAPAGRGAARRARRARPVRVRGGPV
jgi:regulator of sigma E protease